MDVAPPQGTDDLLEAAGYQSGDVVVLGVLDSTSGTLTGTTSSTSFQAASSSGQGMVRWDRLSPTNGTLVVSMAVRFEPGTGETMTGRYFNAVDSEEVASVSGSSGTDTVEHSAWTDYTPTTTDGGLNIRYEHKVDTGNNSSTSRAPSLMAGIQL